MEDEQGILWLATSGGLMKFNKETGGFIHYRNHQDSIVRKACSVRINDFYLDKENGMIYLASHAGFKVFDYHSEKILPSIVSGAIDPYAINQTVITTVTKDQKRLCLVWMWFY